MLANIAKVRQEDAQAVLAKQKKVQILNEEIKLANKSAQVQKEAARKVEKDLDMEIAEHVRRKQEREEAKAREAKRLKEEKEKEI